ncbi:hypothetical protein HK096_010365, partial [Nowakowskiella sp. JEL0078]
MSFEDVENYIDLDIAKPTNLDEENACDVKYIVKKLMETSLDLFGVEDGSDKENEVGVSSVSDESDYDGNMDDVSLSGSDSVSVEQQKFEIQSGKFVAGTKGGVERTFIGVKPDGTQRALLGKILQRFERKGFKLVAIKAVVPSRTLVEAHYEDLKTRPFFKGLVDYMSSGKAPVIAMVWEGKDVIRQGRRIIGATNPKHNLEQLEEIFAYLLEETSFTAQTLLKVQQKKSLSGLNQMKYFRGNTEIPNG